jgi:hypothetical protein
MFESYWIYRNYENHKKVIFFQPDIYYNNTHQSFEMNLFKYLQAWGGDIHWWNPKSEIILFNYEPNVKARKILEKRDVIFPKRALTSIINQDSLLMIRNEISIFFNDTSSQKTKNKYNDILSIKLNKYASSIKSEKPFLYYIGSRFILLKSFIIHSGTYNLFDRPFEKLNIFEIIFKIFMSFIYLFVLIGGFLGILFSIFFYRKKYEILFLCFVAIYSISIFPILKLVEYRYFTTIYPIFLILAISFSINLFSLIEHNFKNKNSQNLLNEKD